MSPNSSKRIDLPRNKSEWKRKSKTVTIPSPGKKRRSGMTEEQKDALHEGEHPVNLTLREVGGLKSGSKIDYSHFLLARILFKLVPVRRIKDKGMFGISGNVQEISRNHLERVDADFNNFIHHIAETGSLQPPPGQVPNLGTYTLARHHHFMVSKKADASSENSPGPAGGRRSLDMPSVSATSETKDHEGDMDKSDIDILSTSQSSKEDDHRKFILEEMLSTFSQQSEEYSDESFRSIGEDIVNVSLIDFLATITMGCPQAKLDWVHLKARIDLDLGKAKIRTINDGCLISRSGGNIFAVAEAKPFRLMDNPVPTVMQMGLEIMAHIYECETTGKKKSRYFMFSQHRCDIYLTWAKFDENYIDYLRGVDAADSSFLHLKCSGPFNIFKASDMSLLRCLVLNLTVQQNKDRRGKD